MNPARRAALRACARGGVLLACASRVALAGAAEAARDGRGHPFEDDLIAHLAGRWDLTRTMGSRQVRNSVVADWVLDHQFLRIVMKDVAQPPQYEAHVYVGYSHADERYVAQWMDVFGGRFAAMGRGLRRDDSIEFRFEYPDAPFYNTFAYDRRRDAWTMTLENGDPSGRRVPFAIDRLQRAP